MSAYTNPKSIDLSSFSPYLLSYNSSGSYCGNAGDIVCTQYFPTTQYSNKDQSGLNINRDKLPYNMPYTVMTSAKNESENSWTDMNVDFNTGYSLSWNNQMVHSLDTTYFPFVTEEPVVSIVTETNTVDMNSFLDTMYPVNGETYVVNGTQTTTETV